MIAENNKLYADEGMILTDGVHYGYEVNLANNADASAWHEITKEAYDEIVQMQESESINGTDDATEADYQNALKRLGVVFNA